MHGRVESWFLMDTVIKTRMCQQLPVHGGAAVRAGVVAVADVLLGHHEVAAGALVLQLHRLLLAVLHHPGHGRSLVCK